MAGRYCSSNIKFNMDDENQRKTWEYLKQSNHRKDGSYAKILSDAFIKSQDPPEEIPMMIPKEVAQLIIDEVSVQLSEIGYSTAKEQKHENVEVITESDENNENTSQDIPAGMLEFFMGQGT